jgi:glycosyltransferase involved in cell wall biosynthesis
MQEIKKRRIVLASVLKPVNDVRMFEKFALTLKKKSDVHLIGYPAKTVAVDDVTFHPLSSFNRVSFKRLLAPCAIFIKILQIKPSILIITTHELLFMGFLAKCFLRCKLFYDVQENYYRNVLYTNAFPPPMRPLLATYIRLKEWISKSVVDHYFLAEAGYQKEMSFPEGRVTIIENKLKQSEIVAQKKHGSSTRLVFTGTLSESTGVFTAIAIAESLFSFDDQIRLTLIGYSPLKDTYQKICSHIKGKDFITLVGGDKLIPHRDIMEAIANADFGIIAYPPNPATENSIPTKLYEYLGCKLPILLINHPTWSRLCASFPAAVTFEPDEEIVPATFLRKMRETSFYVHTPTHIYWESEGERLLKIVFESH